MSSTPNENAYSKQNPSFGGNSGANRPEFSREGNSDSGAAKRTELSKDFHDITKRSGQLATDAATMVQENASQYYDKGMQKAKKFEKSLESRIQKNPIQSLLIVAGVGMVLGALWNRR